MDKIVCRHCGELIRHVIGSGEIMWRLCEEYPQHCQFARSRRDAGGNLHEPFPITYKELLKEYKYNSIARTTSDE